jgi:thioredoxin 1
MMVTKARKQEGKPAPDLGGKAGKWVKKGKTALFYFYSPNCGACKAMTPLVVALSKDKEGVFPIDLSKDMSIARKLGIMATPTTVIIKQGVVEKFLIGPRSKSDLLEQLG